jgi:hypothetical protein
LSIVSLDWTLLFRTAIDITPDETIAEMLLIYRGLYNTTHFGYYSSFSSIFILLDGLY